MTGSKRIRRSPTLESSAEPLYAPSFGLTSESQAAKHGVLRPVRLRKGTRVDNLLRVRDMAHYSYRLRMIFLRVFTTLLVALSVVSCEFDDQKRFNSFVAVNDSGETTTSCRSDDDCAAVINPCDGEPLCARDTPRAPGVCVAQPGTRPVCGDQASPPCTVGYCDRETGACGPLDAATALEGVLCGSDTTCDAIIPGALCENEVCVQPCDDGRSCTTSDQCLPGGECLGETDDPFSCACVVGNDDCAPFGDLCNGTLYCSDSLYCALNPASLVNCATTHDTMCNTNRCDPSTGSCSMQPVLLEASRACVFDRDCQSVSAGDPATCVAGVCTVPCNDGYVCSEADVCTPAGTCVGVPWSEARAREADAPCECETDNHCATLFGDDNLCNGTLYCEKSLTEHSCVVNPATVVNCPFIIDGCLENSCSPDTGLCSMQPFRGVQTAYNCTSYTDCRYDFCELPTGLFFWIHHSECASGTSVSPSFTSCVDGYCDGAVLCDDGNVCNVQEICDGGICRTTPRTHEQVLEGLPVCECESGSECEEFFGDGDACTGRLFCSLGTCYEDGNRTQCPTEFDNTCRVTTCDPATGNCLVLKTNEGAPCEDGRYCTGRERCSSGLCVAGNQSCGEDDDGAEPNDGYDAAFPVTYRFRDALHIFGPDFWSIEVCGGGTVHAFVRFEHSYGDLDLRLIAVDGSTVLDQSLSTNNVESVTHTPASATTVFIEVFGHMGAVNSYSLEAYVDGC